MGATVAEQLNDLLNKAIAREIGVSIQYMWQHVMAIGMESPEIKDIFQDIAIEEMKHAEKKEMIEADLMAEDEAIELYREIIRIADVEKDSTTRLLFEEILGKEEEHKHTFAILLK